MPPARANSSHFPLKKLQEEYGRVLESARLDRDYDEAIARLKRAGDDAYPDPYDGGDHE